MYTIDKKFSPNFSARSSIVPDLLVLHIADGYYDGTIGWFMNKDSQTSSHFVVAKDGRCTQMVDIAKSAWTQGLRAQQIPLSDLDIVKNRGVNPNLYCISIEYEGFYKDMKGELTPEQIDSTVNSVIPFIQSELNRIYNSTLTIDREHIVGHYQINPASRAFCGLNFPYEQIISNYNDNLTPSDNPNTESEAVVEKPAPSADELVAQKKSILYKLQVGAFSDKNNALAFQKNLSEKGYASIILEEEV